MVIYQTNFKIINSKRYFYDTREKYRKRIRRWLINAFGGCCYFCDTTKRLEFAHKKETNLNGRSRGWFTRITDIKKYPNSYFLVCHNCHVTFDADRRI